MPLSLWYSIFRRFSFDHQRFSPGRGFFSVPGMGPLLTDAITRYGLNVVQTLVIIYALWELSVYSWAMF